MPTVDYRHVDLILQTLLKTSGTPDDLAEIVATSLVDANLAGHDSHGVIRVVQYFDQVQAGALNPVARPVIVRERGATVVVDCGWGWGQPAMRLASQEATKRAKAFGIGLAVVEQCYHIGRVAPYVELAAAEGMVALAMSNAGPAVAPYGGRSRVMGTNPIAWAVPRKGHSPISFDVATAVVAEGKLRVAKAKGLPSPVGAVINVDGVPSIDPNDFYDGGALMAFGGHKGSGFSILAQLLGRSLAGMTPDRLAGHRGANGPVIIVIDPEFIAPLDVFGRAIEEQAQTILAADAAESFDEVRLPGQPELEERERRMITGIDIPDSTWDDLIAIANAMNVDLEELLATPIESTGREEPANA